MTGRGLSTQHLPPQDVALFRHGVGGYPSLPHHEHLEVLRGIAYKEGMPLRWRSVTPRASLAAQWERICLPVWWQWVRSLGREDPLEERMTTHSSVPAWEMHRGAWWAAVHGVTKCRTQLRD